MVLPLVDIVMTLLTVGLGLWAMNRYIPMRSTVKNLVNAVVVVVAGIWLLQVTGLWPAADLKVSL